MNRLFEHTDILLRALEPEDLDLLYVWENNADLWKYGNTVSPISRFAIRQYLEDAQHDIFQTRQLRLMITLRDNPKTCVGMIDLFDFEPFHRRAGVGILIDNAYQRNGYALQAIESLKQYCSDFLNLSQLYAHIPVRNRASMNLFQKSGFCEAGILKNWLRINEEFSDVAIVQYLFRD